MARVGDFCVDFFVRVGIIKSNVDAEDVGTRTARLKVCMRVRVA